jgi:O-antigen/teichoic acid export membrane protein
VSTPPAPNAASTEPETVDGHLRSGDAGTNAATGGLLRLGSQIVALVLTLGSTILILRHLGEADFGRLALVLALVTIVVGISDLGLSGVGIREWIRRGPDERRELLADLLGLRLVATGIGGALAIGFALLVGYDSEVVWGAVVAMLGAAFNALQAALAIPLIAQLRQGLVGAMELLRVAVQALLQVVLVLAGGGVVPLAAAMIPAGLAGVFGVLLVMQGPVPRPRFNPGRLRALLRESAAFAAAGAVSIVYLRVAVLLGPGFLDDREFGSFSVSFRAMESLTMLPSILTGALFPVLTHAALHDRLRLARGYDVLWRSASTLGVMTAAGVVGAAPLASIVLGGSRDSITIDGLVLLGLALGALFVGAAGMWMLLAERQYRAVLKINALALTTNLALTVFAGSILSPGWFAVGILASEILIAVTADRTIRAGLIATGHPAPGGAGKHTIKIGLAAAAAVGAFLVFRDANVALPFAASFLAAAIVVAATRAAPSELVAMGRGMITKAARQVTSRRLAG